MPGAPEGLALLASAGYFLGIVSNQRGVALGVTKESALHAIEDLIQQRLSGLGCAIDAFRYCMHDLDAGCACRKPAPGLLLGIGADFGIDLSQSWMIGDDEVDVRAGRAAGCMTALVGSGSSNESADIVAGSLLEASRRLIQA